MDKGRLTAVAILLIIVFSAAAGTYMYFSTNPDFQSPGSSAADTAMPTFLESVYPGGIGYRGGAFSWQRVDEERAGKPFTYWRGIAPDRSVTIIVRPNYEGPMEVERETQRVEHLINIPFEGHSVYVRADVEAIRAIEAVLQPLYTAAEAQGVTNPAFEPPPAPEESG